MWLAGPQTALVVRGSCVALLRRHDAHAPLLGVCQLRGKSRRLQVPYAKQSQTAQRCLSNRRYHALMVQRQLRTRVRRHRGTYLLGRVVGQL